MENIVIGLIIVVLAAVGVSATVKHFQGKSSCCGGGGAYIPRKKLDHVIGKRVVVVEGMTCENCAARVTRAINDLDGLSARVELRRKQVVVSMARQASDDELRAAIEKVGYRVVGFR